MFPNLSKKSQINLLPRRPSPLRPSRARRPRRSRASPLMIRQKKKKLRVKVILTQMMIKNVNTKISTVKSIPVTEIQRKNTKNTWHTPKDCMNSSQDRILKRVEKKRRRLRAMPRKRVQLGLKLSNPLAIAP